MIDIRQIPENELKEWIEIHGFPAYRFKQLNEWIWAKQGTSFHDFLNLPLELRKLLKENFQLDVITKDVIQKSTDGTIKIRFKLHDNFKIEAVLIPVFEENRYTACISTQVGCSLSCKFCATGKMGRIRNLAFTEIFDQVVLVNNICKDLYNYHITNIVYMGMGEPLLNYSQTIKSIEKITNPLGLGMSSRRITISTAGIAKMIRQLTEDNSKVNIALSLHAPTDEKRNQIMPINDQNNIMSLMDALDYHYQKTGNRITFEYIALQDFNESDKDANELLKLTHRFPVRINIIQYNNVEGLDFQRTSQNKLDRFVSALVKGGANVTVRKSRGQDIDAACGQLANKDK